jgi:hypothetical protein
MPWIRSNKGEVFLPAFQVISRLFSRQDITMVNSCFSSFSANCDEIDALKGEIRCEDEFQLLLLFCL